MDTKTLRDADIQPATRLFEHLWQSLRARGSGVTH